MAETDVASLTEGRQHREMGAGSLEVRDQPEGGAREVAGLGVPYNQPIEFRGIREQFAEGSIEADDSVKLFWRHRDPIGKVTASRSDAEGWHHTARISATARGDEAYQLARDGVIDRFSIGFEPIEHTETKEDDGSLTITHTRARVREVSLVPFPAYEQAEMTEVRHAAEPQREERQEQDMATEDQATEVAELRESVDELHRRVEVGLTPANTEHTDVARSFGDLVSKLAHGDERATRAYEAAMTERASGDYTGATSGDGVLEDQWVGNLTQIIHKRQTVAATFARGPLPAKGLSVEYAELADDTTDVDVQAAEGDDLLFGKLSIQTKTAPVKTLGGWSSMSRQAIERTENVNILDTTFTAMAEKYGRAVEAMARNAFNAAVSAAAHTVTGALDTQDDVISAFVDLADYFDDHGLTLDGVFLDKASFKSLYQVSESDRILQVSGAERDKVGTVSINTVSASVSGVPIRVLPGAAADTVVAYDTTALRTLESAGAPIRLQDDNIVNLSRDFSVYGYAASFVQRPAGIVVLTAPSTT